MHGNGDSSGKNEVLKADHRGRLRVSRQRRDSLLAEFERSGLSAVRFTETYGINYQTFMGWRKRRKKESPSQPSGNTSLAKTFGLQEVLIGEEPAVAATLEVFLPGGISVRIGNRDQAMLAAVLIGSLQRR
jgi:transposase